MSGAATTPELKPIVRGILTGWISDERGREVATEAILVALGAAPPAGERVSEEERERLAEAEDDVSEVELVLRECLALVEWSARYHTLCADDLADENAVGESYHNHRDGAREDAALAERIRSLLRTSSARPADLEAISRDIVADGAWFTAETPSELADRFRAILARHLAPTSDTEVECG